MKQMSKKKLIEMWKADYNDHMCTSYPFDILQVLANDASDVDEMVTKYEFLRELKYFRRDIDQGFEYMEEFIEQHLDD